MTFASKKIISILVLALMATTAFSGCFEKTESSENRPPIANAGSDRIAYYNETVPFDTSASYDPDADMLTYAWDFGDGTYGSGKNPSHTYSGIGNYTVSLTVDDGYGHNSTHTISVTVLSRTESEKPVENNPPIANAGLNQIVNFNDTVKFNASASSDSDSDTLNYTWNLGDGSYGSGVNLSHKYNNSGNYTVTLTVDDGHGHTSNHSILVRVLSRTEAEPVENHPPIANAGINQTMNFNETVLFDGSASYDSDADALNYTWDFGDGTYGYSMNISHTYNSPGNYTATLTVGDGHGHSSNHSIVVKALNRTSANSPPIITSMSTTASVIECEESVAFRASAYDQDNDTLNYTWDFGDGTYGTGANPNHIYNQSGNYNAFLTVDDGHGHSTNHSMIVNISNKPTFIPSQLYIRIDANKDIYNTGENVSMSLVLVSLNYSRNFGYNIDVVKIYGSNGNIVWQNENDEIVPFGIAPYSQKTLWQFKWNQTNNNGAQVASGFYRINATLYGCNDTHYPCGETWIEIRTAQPQLNLSNVTSLNTISSYFDLNQTQNDSLANNWLLGVQNFSKYDNSKYNNFASAYDDLKGSNIPIFVTTDSILHTYHIFFDDLLRSIEENYLINYSKNMTIALLTKAKQQYENITDTNLKELARKNVAYFSVALKLIDPNATIPSYVAQLVSNELSLIENHSGPSPYQIFDYYDPSVEMEDYSQYVPRGHYTRSEELKHYFKEMMWYGRMPFKVKYGASTEQAILIADAMKDAKYNNHKAADLWNAIYNITVFFVGNSDDLTYMDYQNVTSKVYGTFTSNYSALLNNSKLETARNMLKNLTKPKISSEWIVINISEDLSDTTLAMRLMGQRFIPDSYMFQELVFNKVLEYTGTGDPFTKEYIANFGDGRAFPRGLDVFSVLGSERANEILEKEGDTEYTNYTVQLDKLRNEFSNVSEENWTQNLYWSWLYSLDSLNSEFNDSKYPTFMKSDAWLDEKLNTNLGSWTELRHDTILYAKQSNTAMATGAPPQDMEKGYVEPTPEFYSRLYNLTSDTISGLSGLNVLTTEYASKLNSLKNLIADLKGISNKELNKTQLTDADYTMIGEIGDTLEYLTDSILADGKETTMIADVHTDGNTGQCLEEAVGYVDYVIIVVENPNGTLSSMAGPIFSYYEFKQPINNRLTDEQWKGMLKNGSEPSRPGWTEGFTGTNKKESNTFDFLFVEAMSYDYTELVSGNYIDGPEFVDKATYFVNETNSTCRVVGHSDSDLKPKQDGFRLLYGSGGWVGGLLWSGAGTGLDFINYLPFRTNGRVYVGNYSFNVSLEVTSDLIFRVNGSVLPPGQSLNYSYDFQKPYKNYNNETYIIRYYGWTIIKNYGIWNSTQIYCDDKL
ncbi:MAG: DUF3160 domain-containing protein [Thermoplasmata archaeon]